MKKELEDKLFEKYKNIFPNGRDVDPTKNLMCFGFSHGDGWYNIVDEFLEKINKLLDGSFILDIIQIKEKFGSLRIYYDLFNATEKNKIKISNLEMEAEKKSFITCEVCGEPGSSHNNCGWVSTVCDKHKDPIGE